ncbi:MAG: N-formylglutamate amidohydrolase [Planctomycetota bacterium]
MKPRAFVISCEHGGNQIPDAWASWFDSPGAKADLRSHRGYDPGALQIARFVSEHLECPFFYATVSRLVVDLNRSLDHENLFSKYSRMASSDQRQRLLQEHYTPYRSRAMHCVDHSCKTHQVIHLSIHTFTPRMRGVWRPYEIGLLFDPGRVNEADFCAGWREAMLKREPALRIRFNEPYAGVDDGLTTAIRHRHNQADYLGIELELNQRVTKGCLSRFQRLLDLLVETLANQSDATTKRKQNNLVH